jgi:hypothetical protein
VYCIDSPPERLRRTPPGGQRQRTGEAGSAAFAWKAFAVGVACALTACSAPRAPSPGPAAAPPSATSGGAARPLPPPVPGARARSWEEFRIHVGNRLVVTNPNGTYTGLVPEPLLAIPVLEIELNGDGSVRRVTVQRHPSQALDTVQLAIDAVHRAAPFGDVSHLPRPWKFSEIFLFRDDRRFKPRALDL